MPGRTRQCDKLVAAPFNDQAQYLRQRCADNLILFGWMFLPGDFLKTPTPQFHHEIGARYIDESLDNIVQVVYRSAAKSTLTKAYILHKFCYSHVNRETWELYPPDSPEAQPEFIGWVAESGSQSKDNLDYVAYQIENNQRIISVFGDQYENRDTWNKQEIITSFGNRLIAKGMKQKLRGKTEKTERGAIRFSNLILDDIESEENTKTPQRRRDNKDWILGTCLPAVGRPPDKGRLIINGTIVHKDSFLQEIVDVYRQEGEDSGWNVYFKRATHDGQLNNDSVAAWPERIGLDFLRKERQKYTALGRPSKFEQEYMNNPRAVEDQIIREDQLVFKNYRMVKNTDNDLFVYDEDEDQYYPIYTYLGVDCASSLEEHRAYSTIIPIGIDPEWRVWVFPYYRKRVQPLEHGNAIFDYYHQFRPTLTSIEPIGYQISLQDYLVQQMKQRGTFIPGVGRHRKIKVPRSQDKYDRAEGRLQPLFANGQVVLQRHMEDLIYELTNWDQSATFDCVDGLYYALEGARAPGQQQVRRDLEHDETPYLPSRQPGPSEKKSWITGMSV